MLLCQISDPHIVQEGTLAYGKVDTPAFLARAVAHVRRQPRQPDAVVEKQAAPSRGATGVRAGAVSPDEAPAARLLVTAGPLKGTSLPLGSAPVLVGRAPTCTLVIDDDYCSARHCRIFPDHGEWKVEDLGSTNGTYLGNQRVTDPVPLRRGDQVRIGATTLELGA